jgi:outer membrane protein assembly factor BamB/tetratricopeptide (TPR) repeat protein
MSLRTHRLLGLLGAAAGLLLLTVLSDARAQRRPAPKTIEVKAEEEKTFTDAVTVPTNRESKRLIQAAQDYIKKKEWQVAAECLQSLLEDKQDSFIEVDAGPDDKGKATKRRVSVRTEANRLIGELPPDGLESYQVKYGQTANDRLKVALDTNDPALLAEVALRYLHSKAGADATNLLGTYYLDRGEYLMSALSFERLLSRPDAAKLPTKVLFKAALAYRRMGDLANSDKVWKMMADKAGRGDLAFGSRKVTLDQVRAEFERAATQIAQAGQSDWWLFRGNPARNAQGVGGTAYLEPRWQYDMAPVDDFATDQQEQNQANRDIRKDIQKAFMGLEGKPILPAFFPISANGKLLVRTYDGVHAVSIRGEETADGRKKPGEMLWIQQDKDGLHALIANPEKRLTLQGWSEFYLNQSMGPVGVFFENSTIGTLAHDGKNVYFVDDLAVPPHPSLIQQANFGNPTNYGKLNDDVQFSRLKAVNLEDGKLQWTIGDHRKHLGKEKDDAAKDVVAGLEFMDSYFLGPPLPLGGKLYVLVEKNTELRLLCLNPSRLVTFQNPNEEDREEQCPELVWQQSLGTANLPVPRDSLRRMQASHLAYADGILVCPTNAGVIVGVDLLSHSLVWAHSYRDGVQQPGQDEMMNFRRGGMFIRGGIVQMGGGALTPDRWRPSAPIIQAGKVVFTAYDGGELHCLNLRDGRLLWHVKREDDDLYLAGVFGSRVVLVGKGYARAVNLDDGKPLWKQPTGMPSGQGAASGDIYYLPLAWAADDAERKPAVLAINVSTGKPVAPPAKSRKKEPLGNLVFVDGELISQTALTVAAFPELKRMLAEIDHRLKENPTDPVGLTERGELYLDKGDLKGAVNDFRTALANKPSADVLGKAKTKLHEALTDLLQTDFPAAEKYLDEYHDLCRLPAPADADANTRLRLAEERLRREVNYLSLLGRGREQQGRLLDAFAAYEEFGTLTGNKELVSVVDEPNTKSRPDVWSRGRIKGMLDKASSDQRKLLDDAIEKKWAAIRSGGDLDAVRRFVSVFGTHSKVGREAQFQLAERLIAAGGPDDLTEAETKLQALCFSPEVRRQDPPAAAKAIEAMIRVYLKRGLYEDAVGFYKQLGADFATVPVRDGKTGADMLNELFTDKRFLPYLEPLGVQWKGALRTHEESRGQVQANQMRLTIDPAGDGLLPFFQRHRIVMDMNQGGPQQWTLRLLDRATGEERWQATGLSPAQYLVNASPPFAHAAGHTLVLHLNHMIYAFNLAEHKKLWEYSLFGKNAALVNPNQNGMSVGVDGRITIHHPEGRTEMLGGIGLVEPSYVVLVTRDGLVAIDPTRASTPASVLWTKSDVSTRAQLFGDDEHVYVVEPGSDANQPTVRALRAQDGVTVPVPDFSRLLANRVRTDGRRLLVREDDPQGGKAVRLYDVQSGQDVWRSRFSAGAIVVQSQDPDLTGVIEKDNTVTLLNFRTGAVLFKTLILPEHATDLEGATLLGDDEHFYLTLVRKAESGIQVIASANTGIRSLPVNGPVYALNRGTGKLEWVCDFVPHQMLLLEQYQDLPILLFTSQYHKTANGFVQQKVKVTGVDKRTGKLIYDKEFTQNGQFVLRIDAHAGLIELVRGDLRIQFRLEGTQAARAEAPAVIAGAAPVFLPGRAPPIRR